MRAMVAVTLLMATGCKEPGEPSPTLGTFAELQTPDPDVNTYVPPSFPAANPERIVFLGDSITHGFGVDNERNTYPSLLVANNDSKWPSFADDALGSRYAGLEVVDVSQDGATTTSVLSSQLFQLTQRLGTTVSGPTLVVGTMGGNDLLDVLFSGNFDRGIADLLSNLEAITDFFLDEATFPDGAYLALGNIYDPTDGVGQVDDCFFGVSLATVIDEFERVADESRALAERDGWAWVDLRGHFIGHGFRYDEAGNWADPEDPTLWFQDDCIHPNTRGHHEIRRLFLAALDAEPLPLLPPP